MASWACHACRQMTYLWAEHLITAIMARLLDWVMLALVVLVVLVLASLQVISQMPHWTPFMALELEAMRMIRT